MDERDRQKAIGLANYIHCSEHEWPTKDDIPLLCSAILHEVDCTDTIRAQLSAMTARAERAEQAAIDLAKEVEIRSILEHVERERNTLAAQLAAANERAEKAEAERADALRCSGENAKAWQEAVCDEAVKRTHLLKEIGLTEQQRDALAARVAELEAALLKLCNEVNGLRSFEHEIRASIGHTNWSVLALREAEGMSALARTAPQSLALVREAAQECQEVMPDDLPHLTYNQLIDMADRLEAEAKAKDTNNAPTK